MELKSEAEKRIEECRKCDERRDLPFGVVQCKKCGCIMNAKAQLNGAKCPLGKW